MKFKILAEFEYYAPNDYSLAERAIKEKAKQIIEGGAVKVEIKCVKDEK
jgi:hypothetical protein